ncbi:hypothetical protein FXO37_05163 [Capsicum annuum]|nr:hypothetical protein FXO37_05163 [Capsicum annuum]
MMSELICIGYYSILDSKRRQETTRPCLAAATQRGDRLSKWKTTDEKRLQSTLKRIDVNVIPAIEKVNIFKEDDVIQFINPKVQASIAANALVVGPNNLEDFKKFAKQFQKQASGAAAGIDAAAGAVAAQEDEDEVPELVAGETFKATTKEGHTF